MSVQIIEIDSSPSGDQEATPSTSFNILDRSFDSSEKKILDYDALYEQVNQKAKEIFLQVPYEEKCVQHPSLGPELRPYQAKAVNWMIHKEITSEIKGGILADEMGLGKTVEVLALILNRPREWVDIPDFLKLGEAAELKLIHPTNVEGIKRPKIKKLEESVVPCLRCSPENFRQIIENDWRSSTDMAKATIQAVIDKECGISPPKNSDGKKVRLKCTCSSTTQLSVKQRLQSHYENALAEYSCIDNLNAKKNVDDDFQILCVCGDIKANKTLVECLKCKRMQHASCVNYDVNNRELGCYYCPQCWVDLEPIKSSATLIITPSSIAQQWADEIQRHLRKQLNVLIYRGVRGQGYHQPIRLAKQYDIIIASYDTLRKELHFADVLPGEKRSRRIAASYMPPPSPLMSIEFWRVCLDEAQMAEGSQTQAAKMARKFKTVHRWCVTGTPIQKSVHDLYGLLLFLGIDVPKYTLGDTSALTEILASIFWRTRKSMVTDQIHIPEQKEYVHWLSFSAVEQDFYKEQQAVCAREFLDRLGLSPADLEVKLSSLDSHRLKVLLNPLLRLRQACVHPQMVRGQFLNMRIQTRTMTMEEVLSSLIKRAQYDSEESHRLRVAAANGLAALHAIKGEWSLAAEKYREVLRWSEEVKESVKTDNLQKLHTMHNLADILRTAPAGTVPPTLRDDSLDTEVEQLRKLYLERVSGLVEDAKSELAPLSATVATLNSELDSTSEALNDFWWNSLLLWANGSNLTAKLVEYINERINSQNNFKKTSFDSFHSIEHLRSKLLERLEKISEQRTKLREMMRLLEVTSTERLANEAAACHLRPAEGRQKRFRCQLCKINEDIASYESSLFLMQPNKKEANKSNANVEGASATKTSAWSGSRYSEVKQFLKLLVEFAKKHHPSRAIIQAGETNLKLIDAINNEFPRIRDVWKRLSDQAAAVDELSMATIRLRLRLPHELPQPKPSVNKNKVSDENQEKETPIFLLEKHEVGIHRSKLQGDLLSATNSLKSHMGRVSFLKNLEKQGYGKTGSQNVDPCPLCTTPLGYRWSALPCGHCFCMECIRQLIKGLKSLKCGLCRALIPLNEITYVDATNIKTEESEINVVGSHSTKIAAIVRKLLVIRAQDPTAKCLIFSTWVDVLWIVGRALDDNGISHCALLSSKGPQELTKFKTDPSVVALLIPVNSGANGLNLTEATHILLVEPILNPGNELQAIGRIHRIGQTKPTFVHKFLIRNTIEEKMAAMLDKHRLARSSLSAGSIKENPVTVADLKSLFLQESIIDEDTS